MRLLRFSAVSRADRHVVTDACKEAIGASGGWVDDALFYSNKAVTLRFTVPGAAVPALRDRLEALDLRLDGPTPEEAAVSAAADVPGTLALTFVHDEPDLRRDIPAVPG
ncbi:hypothetical protein [Caenispirillum bisanense]|uniref:Uncharacterized protein n=1 Tax=Caenispirillum bisanense TaxID=414052 RepID=A0A286GAX0_9PROT|nr:hypothetical protein [Caenispirillum bisanense]SOD92650.1 hypothetical protein SAMN05421508_102541 [Caenispirillum bisanense]